MMKRYWPYLLISMLHYLLTIACFLTLFAEGLDRATGEDKVAISPLMFEIAQISQYLLLIPVGWLVVLNQSMALGLFAINSLIVGFSPILARMAWHRFRQ